MEQSLPKPVTFKSFASDSFSESGDSEPLKTLSLEHMDIEYYKPTNLNGYFLLVSHNDPSNPVKLYPSGMNRLYKALDPAFQKAHNLEIQDVLPDEELYNCGTINEHGNMVVRLVVSTFKGKAFVWLRLYVKNENKEFLPTKRGVRFSASDDLQAISDFINNFL